jgi:hypothetical protein
MMLFTILYEEDERLFMLAMESDWDHIKKHYHKKKGRTLHIARSVNTPIDDLPVGTPVEIQEKSRFFECCA